MAGYDLGTVSGTIEITYNGEGVDEARRDVSDLAGQTESSAGDAEGTLGNLSTALIATGAAGVAGLGLAAKTAADFETAMSEVKAVSGATGTEFDSLTAKARQLGRDTAFGATDAANAMAELVKAGVPVEDVLNGAADATVNLAAAGGIDLVNAAAIASNALNQFGLSGAQMPRVADLIAGAANASSISVADFGASMTQVGAVANTVGFSFDDTAVAITALGKAGIVGSDAGTSLKTMLLNLQPSTKQQSALFDELGITTDGMANKFYDAQGNVKSMAEVAGVLEEATRGMTKEQKIATLETMFGSDAIRAAAVFAEQGAAGFNELSGAINGISAADVAATRMDNFNGKLENAKGSLEDMAISIGNVLLPMLSSAAEFVGKLADKFSQLDPGTQAVIVQFIAFSSAALIIIGSLIKLGLAIKNAYTGFIVLKTAFMSSAIGTALTGALSAIGTALLRVYISFMTGIARAYAWAAAQVAAASTAIAAWARAAAAAVANAARVAAAWAVQAARGFATFVASTAAQAATVIARWAAMAAAATANAARMAAAWIAGVVAGAATAVASMVATAATYIARWVAMAAAATVNAARMALGWVIGVVVPAATAIAAMIGAAITYVAQWVIMAAGAMANAAIAAAAWLIALGPIGLLIAAIVAAVALIILNWDKVKAAAIAVWGWLGGFLSSVWNGIKAAAMAIWNAISMFFTTWWTIVSTLFTTYVNIISTILSTAWNVIKTVITTVWEGIKLFFTTWWTIVQTIFSAAISIISGVLSAAWTAIKAVVEAIWNGIVAFFTGVWNVIAGIFTGNGDRIKSGLEGIWNAIKGTVEAIWNAISAFFSSVWSTISSTVSSAVSSIQSAIGNAFEAARNLVMNAINGIKDAVVNGFNTVVGEATALPGKVLSALGNLGSYLVASGRALVQGFIDGIKAMIGAVANAASSVVSAARDMFPFSPAKEGPMSGRGWVLYSGHAVSNAFADGMGDRIKAVSAAAEDVVGSAAAWFNEVFPEAQATGEAIVSQFQHGIESQYDPVMKSVAAFADQVNQHFAGINAQAQGSFELAAGNVSGKGSFAFDAGNGFKASGSGQVVPAANGQGSSLIGNLTLQLPQDVSAQQMIDAALFEVRRVGKGVFN